MNFVDRIARIRIELKDIDPTIWRRVEVPLTTSLKGLHDVIQSVMPFENYHLFRFDVGDKRYGIPDREWDHVPVSGDVSYELDRQNGNLTYAGSTMKDGIATTIIGAGRCTVATAPAR